MSQKKFLPDLETPDFIEPLRAYRAWQWQDGEVYSLNGKLWVPREAMVATCNIREQLPKDPEFEGSHESPHPGCTCGVYAGKNLEHLVEIGYAQFGIHGEVDMWGKVMECTLGYRAQYAYPRYFVIPPAMICGELREAEFRVQTLARFEIPLYLGGGPGLVSKDDPKFLLWKPGEGYQSDGLEALRAYVQGSYDAVKRMKKIPDPETSVGQRVMIHGKGIGVIREVTGDKVMAMLYNTQLVTVPRKEVIWNPKNMIFECKPSKITTRSVTKRVLATPTGRGGSPIFS